LSYSAEELAILTPDEQSALLAEEAGDPVVNESTENAASEVAATEGVAETGEETASVVDEGATDDHQESTDGAAVEPEETDNKQETAEFHPELNAAAPEGLQDRLKDLEKQSAELVSKMEQGEISFQEFYTKKDDIDAEKLKLILADQQAQWAEKQNTESRDQRWKWEQDRFFAQKSSEMYNDPLVFAALNASVKQLAVEPGNASRPASWFLEEADRQVRQRFNLGVAAVTPTVTTPKPKVPTVRTIGSIPAAAPAPIGDDVMGKIGTLEGEDLEKYVARMSPADVDKLLRSA